MSADKRSVSTDALETLGTLIGPNEKRDAIHLAVIPVKAGACLRAGMFINQMDGVAEPYADGLGIVDPFVKGEIQTGQMFWMVLRPRIIKSLRHVWSHPSFPDEVGPHAVDYVSPEKAAARAAIEAIADRCDISADQMIEGARAYLSSKGYAYLCEGGRWEGMSVPDEFWNHYEILTGEKVAEDDRGSFFSCSC